MTVVCDSVSLYACNFLCNISSVPPFALERTDEHGEGQVFSKCWKARSCKGGVTVVAVD